MGTYAHALLAQASPSGLPVCHTAEKQGVIFRARFTNIRISSYFVQGRIAFSESLLAVAPSAVVRGFAGNLAGRRRRCLVHQPDRFATRFKDVAGIHGLLWRSTT